MIKLLYRHEWKHRINYCDMLQLRQRLSAVAQRDSHAENGIYEIRSLYFDNDADKALREKIDGVNMREKFRLRRYNGDNSYIVLEKKSKLNGLCRKDSQAITADQAQALVNHDYRWLAQSGSPLFCQLYSKMAGQGLKAKTIVDYTREPFVFAPGNVRITLDYNIRTGLKSTNFLSGSMTIPAGEPTIILEVKWDEFLPDIIRDAVRLEGRRTEAFSKYAACRIYG